MTVKEIIKQALSIDTSRNQVQTCLNSTHTLNVYLSPAGDVSMYPCDYDDPNVWPLVGRINTSTLVEVSGPINSLLNS